MAPKDHPPTGQYDLFQKRTEEIVHENHPLVILAKLIDWNSFSKSFGEKFHPRKGRPGLSTRLMVGLHYIKHTYNLSDEAVLSGFAESPQWQYFCGSEYYICNPPCDRSSMTYWRKRMGEEKMGLLLKETIEVAKRCGFIKKGELQEIVVDTTVQEKNIEFPTDSGLYYKALKRLVHLSKQAGIKLRQTYKRKAKEKLVKRNRLAVRGKRKEAMREEKKLKTYLGRIIREMERKIETSKKIIKGAGELKESLEISKRIWGQERGDKGKVYSVHEREVKCYGKGKAHKRYEFGSKVSVAITARNCWVIGIKTFTESVHDVLTLIPALEQAKELTGEMIRRVYVDKGYRGKRHHPEEMEVCVSGDKRSKEMSQYEKRKRKRRSCVEGIIGHMKTEGRMGRNFLWGEEGDRANAVLCGVGQNMRKLVREIRGCPHFFILFFKEVYFLLKRALFGIRRLQLET